MKIIHDISAAQPGNASEEAFEKLYIASRKRESRLYTDEQTGNLPSIEPSHIHHGEWRVRKRSAARLIAYLKSQKRPLSILETGCGNGWLSAKIADIPNAVVTGMDINKTELNQARRVFGNKDNLAFVGGDIRDMVPGKGYDIIIFAASIQYFSSVREILTRAFSLLNMGGEIHLLDSFFYKADEQASAKRRSRLYYSSLGCIDLSAFYFHHTLDSLNDFSYKMLFDPAVFINRIFNKRDPFPWIRILPT
jgi:ubiquinone/menaquinone biosynthesis C-methylase UbiE